jgi:hypothetical protein
VERVGEKVAFHWLAIGEIIARCREEILADVALSQSAIDPG